MQEDGGGEGPFVCVSHTRKNKTEKKKKKDDG
jgi:hypothetical protein